jgi:hypothetical protein
MPRRGLCGARKYRGPGVARTAIQVRARAGPNDEDGRRFCFASSSLNADACGRQERVVLTDELAGPTTCSLSTIRTRSVPGSSHGSAERRDSCPTISDAVLDEKRRHRMKRSNFAEEQIAYALRQV